MKQRKIEPGTINDYEKKMKDLTSRPKVLISKPPAKQKGSWFEEFVLDRVIDFIRSAVNLTVYTQEEQGKLVLHITVMVAGRKLLEEKVKLL